MISIQGLNKKQIAILNHIWSLNTIEDIRKWQYTLPLTDQFMVEALMLMVNYAYIDELVDEDNYCAMANEVLSEILNR